MMSRVDYDRLATVAMPPLCPHGSLLCAVNACIVARMRLDRAFVERVAHYAAQRGDSELECTCDEVTIGRTDISMLRSLVDSDVSLHAWCLR